MHIQTIHSCIHKYMQTYLHQVVYVGEGFPATRPHRSQLHAIQRYACTCIRIYIRWMACMYIYSYLYTLDGMHVHIFIFIYVGWRACAYIHIYICWMACMCIYSYLYTLDGMHVHVFIFIYVG